MSDIRMGAELDLNVTGVQSGSAKAVSSLEAIQAEMVKTQAAMASATDGGSLDRLGQKLSNLQANFNSLNTGGGASGLAAPIKAATAAGQELGTTMIGVGDNSRALSQLMNRNLHGVAELFISPSRAALILANDIPQLIARFRELSAANAELAAAGKKSASTSTLLAQAFDPLNLAIGLGLAILIRYGGKIYDWATNADKAKASAAALKKEQDDLNNITLKANQTAGDQIGKLETLQATMTNSNLTLAKRKEAYNEVQKLYPSYLKNVTQDEALNGALASTIQDKLIPAILAAAQARAYGDKINKLTAENIDLKDKETEAINKSASAMANYQKIEAENNGKSAPAAPIGALSGASIQDPFANQTLDAKNAAQKIVDAQEAITKSIGDNTNKINGYMKQMQTAIAQTGSLNIEGKDVLSGSKVKKNAETVQSILADLQKSFADTDKQIEAHTTSVSQVAKINLGQVEKAINDLINIGIKPSDPIIQGLDTLLNHFKNLTTNNDVIHISLPKIDYNEPTVDPKKQTGLQKYFAAQKAADDKAAKDYEKSLKQTAAQITNIVENGIGSIAEGIGKAIGSGDFSFNGIFAPFLDGLGSAIEEFGKEIIAKSALMKVLQTALNKALESGQWEAGIGIGIALVAAGAALKAFANKGIGGHSSSGGSSAPYYAPQQNYYNPAPSSPYSGANASANAIPQGGLASALGSSVAAIPVNVTVDGQIKNDVIRLANINGIRNYKR